MHKTGQTPLNSYEQLEVKKELLEATDSDIVEEGISEWASAFLIVNSDSKDKDITDKVLYNSISNKKQREKLKDDRTKFYKDSTVLVEDVQAEVVKSNKADFKGREVGVVECKVTATGKRNEENFEKAYTIELVVDYKADIASVYEVRSITWK